MENNIKTYNVALILKVILTPRQLCSHMAGVRDYKRKAGSTVEGQTTEAQDVSHSLHCSVL